MKRFTNTTPRCAALVALVVATSACGRDHAGLALKDHAPGGASGSGGLAGTGGSGGRSQGGSATGGSDTGTGGKIVEPPGRSVTTFFHGIVDADRILFCFARHDEATPVLVGSPRPTGGLEYGASITLESIRGIDFDAEPVLPYVIAGQLELVAGMNCDDAIQKARGEMAAVNASALGAGGVGGASGAGGESGSGGEGGGEPPVPPRLRVASLAEIPAGTLSAGHSSLYVAVGCLGGPAFTSDFEEDACGSDYSPRAPNASALLVTLSRSTAFDELALQALHASLALPALTVLSSPPDTAVQASVPIAYDLHRGVLAPRSPSTALSVTDYGVNSPDWKAEATSDGTTLVSEAWTDVFERAGLDGLANSRGYTLVVVGPRGSLGHAGFWNQPAIGVVDNDPTP